MPTVSVVIPAYNAERYIRETLDSVLAQTHRDLEVVVVDDGSTDSTRGIVASYGGPVRCIEQENAGPSPARNRGIREARGELIAFVDSDDLWTEDKLAAQVPLFDDGSRVGLVYGHAERMAPDGQTIPTPHPPKPTGRVFVDFLFRNHCPTSAAVVRRECFERCGMFREDMVWAEDWHLWLRIARHYEFAAVERVVVRHRVHAAGLTRRHEEAYVAARGVLKGALDESDGPELRTARRCGLHRLDRNHALSLLALGEAARARRSFWRAMGNGPTDLHAAAGFVASLLPGALRRLVMAAWKRAAPWLPWGRNGRMEMPGWEDAGD
jgi:glycosyltransferase involved in cell wall biosynthesis